MKHAITKGVLFAAVAAILGGCGSSEDGGSALGAGTGGSVDGAGGTGGSPAPTTGSGAIASTGGAGGGTGTADPAGGVGTGAQSPAGGAGGSTGGTAPAGGAGGSTGGAAPAGGAGGSTGGAAPAGGTGAQSPTGGAGGSTGGTAPAGGAAATGGAGQGQLDHSTFTEILGWATMEGGTTGGGDATPEFVDSLDALNDAAGGSDPRVIYVSGQFNGRLSVGSNKTIIGLPGTQISSGGNTLSMSGENVILRNIAFIGDPDGSADMANISGGHHMWLDHLELVDGGDGMLDIVNGSNYITISWCKMRYTEQTGHQNAMLLSSSNGAGDDGKNKITFHHNWWSENVAERMPRVRFGEVHIFNNLYIATPDFTYYAIRCGYDANVLSERNVYKDFTGTSPLYDGGAVLVFNYFDGSDSSVLETIDDVFVNCTERAEDADGVEGGTFGNGTAFRPPYAYTMGSTDTLEAAVRSGAGPTLQIEMP